MKHAKSLYRFGAALAVAATLFASPARADLVLLGSDYFRTIQPTFAAGIGTLAGLPIGPGDTDTRVQRQGDCSLTLSTAGSNCTISIELVALSLISTVNPMVRVRESPTLASAGGMTMTSDGGTGGTFASFFDVFFEISLDGGASWAPQGPLTLTSSGAHWTTIEPVDPLFLFVDGPVGDPNANRHSGKGPGQFDFYVVDAAGGVGTNIGPDGTGGTGGPCATFVLHQHGANFNHCTVPARIPEPGSLALAGLALTAMIGLRRRSTRRVGARAE